MAIINGRGIAGVRSGVAAGPSTPSMVMSGLVLNLDAGNTSSYPGTGTVWTDISGNGNNGTLINSGSGLNFNSANGGSLLFDGLNDYVSITNSSTINITSTLTLSAFIKPNNISGWKAIVYKNTPYGSNGYHMGIDPSGYLQGGIKNPNWNTIQSTTNKLDLNLWQNVTMVLDLPNSTLKLFKNGINIKTVTNFNFTIVGNNLPLVIGSNSTTPQELYSGNISNVQLYNKALSDAEVSQNYNALKGIFGL